MELTVNEREALLIVTALGTYQNRVGQHCSWDQRKRMNTLRQRLANAITIGDTDEEQSLRRVIKHTTYRINRSIALGVEVSTLRERLKADAGICDERISTDEG